MRRIMLLIAVCGLSVYGCSSGGSSSSASAGSGAPVSLSGTTNEHGTGDATSGKLDVEMDDFYFGPTFIKVAPGAQVTLHLKNEGKAQHTFTSAGLGVDQVVAPGSAVDVNVTAPGSGAVEFHCRFHQSQGMQGAVFQKAGDTLAGAGAGSSSSSSSSSSGNGYN